jgi:hypothetical protein
LERDSGVSCRSKDKANYGIESVRGKDLDAVMKQAKRLFAFAEETARQ